MAVWQLFGSRRGRKLMRVAIIISVVVNFSVALWAATDSALHVVPVVVIAKPAPSPAVAPEPIAPEPIAVEYIVLPSTGASGGNSASSGSLARIASTSASRGSTETSTQPSEPKQGKPTHSDLMTMPKHKPTIEIGPDFMADFLARSKPLPPIPDLPGARIDADIKDIRAKIRSGHGTGDDYAALAALNDAKENVELKPAGGGRYESKKTTFVAKVDPDGTVHIKNKPNLQIDWWHLSATFDVTDAVMRSHGADPYASEKAKFLDRTRDQRVEIGRAYKHEQLTHSAELMQQNVIRFWATTTDLRARKQNLFELWDECAETGDDDLVAGGNAARQFVLGFIQTKLRGADAYTAAELAQLNAHRHSKLVFAP